MRGIITYIAGRHKQGDGGGRFEEMGRQTVKVNHWRRRDYFYLAVGVTIIVLLIVGIWINLPS